MSFFAGVRFALLGFDPVSDAQYRSEMALHGGAEAGGAQEGRTHLVVSGLVYDDPVCVAARKDGTKVVTALWVDDCLVLGAMADADHVLYRPVRDLEGIPGAESLCICLTGYQRQNGRESIMKMVNMMGAWFSKPLTAKRVTHLICYKFEGEKYELAKAVKINTVNHQWLEDCLKAWDILPVDNYTARSGWELEIVVAEAKDSEDEAESDDRGSSDSRGIARSIPATEIAMRTPADLDGHIPNHCPSVFSGNAEIPAGTHVGTSQQIREVKDASEWSVDVTVDTLSTTNTNSATISANPDGHTHIDGPTVFIGNADAVVPAGRRLETSQQIREAEDVSKRSLDVRSDRLSTPNTDVVTISAHPDAHTHASQVDKVEVEAADSEHDKSVSRAAFEAGFEAGPKEIPITAVPGEDVRNPGAKRSRIPEDETVNGEGSTSKVSSSASADNPETCSPSRTLKRRVCKAVAKRRTNAGNWTVYKGFHNDDEAWEDRSDLQSSKPRSSKRQKIDHNKENRRANTSLAPECVAVKNNEFMIDDCSSMTGGNDDGSSAVWEPEPTWFDLSGHRLLRKQCRSILLRLKGRVCSHSDHWSFQATHFITPELRRAEKFFAATAAVRWILKPKYLFAYDEVGKLVDVESLKWHGDGLNDNHTISMDSPRKWRHLKQRTGHGAFDGMQIIIYGECISPSLDTLRCAVRAGDGMILATAPPYTRFLKLGAISFAVVCVGTPSSNAWVQEFKSHGIPSMSPSYLVDYVCKPSHLKQHKHVLFDMQDLADESLLKLLSSQEGCRAEQSCSSGTMMVVAVAENMHGPPHCIEDASSNRKPVQIFIKNGRPTLTLNVKLDEPSRNMVETYKSTSNWKYSDFYFSFKNKIIRPDRTLTSYGICKGSTIDLNTRVRGGGISFEEYVETYKHTFTEIVKLPDGNLSLKVPLGGCQFLSSFLSCVITTWSRKKCWNGQIQWNTHFRVTDGGIVQVASKATTSLESSCMEIDVPPIIEFLDYAFSNKDIRLLDRRPPYFNHLITYLREMKSAVLSTVDKLVIASHPGYMLPYARLMLTISLRRKYKSSSKQEKDKWDVAIEKASSTIVWTDKLMELPVFKDVKEGADEIGESYPANMKTKMSLRVSRDYSMHVLEHRWVDDPNAKPSEKDKQIEKFKDDDGVELMLPMHIKTFLANLIEELVTADIDINRELSSALVHCTKCQIEQTPVVAEPIGANYLPTWMQALTKAERSDMRNKEVCGIIGRNPPRPKNWTTVPKPKATGECSESTSTANKSNHPNPWNKAKTLGLFAGQTGTSSSRPPENSTAGAVQAQPSNPMALVSTQTTQAASVSTKTTEPQVTRSRAAKRNAKRREKAAWPVL